MIKTATEHIGQLLVLCLFLLFTPMPGQAQARTVHYVHAEGVINPIMAEYLITSLEKAAAEGAEAVIIQLDTPGGLDLSMRDIIKEMLSSEVPTVVYVAPSGSRAASAGVFIAYAANVAAMAPGTNIGSASPVAIGGDKMDETMAKKIENDAVAYIKSIATKRGRNAEWAELAVRQSVNLTAKDALAKNVVNIIADSREDLLVKLDGRKVDLPAGVRALATQNATVTDVEMNLRHRILSAISNPNVAYILMMIGLLGLYFELSNPGLILPGVIGAVCLVLAFYAFQTLSVNYAGLILIALGLVFFILEIKIISYGLLSIAGVVSFTLGSLMLFESPAPFMRLSLWVVLPSVGIATAFMLGMMYYAVTIHKKRPVSGVDLMIGSEGAAEDDFIDTGFSGEFAGRIFIEGEFWNATASGPLARGDHLRVIEAKGLVLKVERVTQKHSGI